jgi:hypothetical protein
MMVKVRGAPAVNPRRNGVAGELKQLIGFLSFAERFRVQVLDVEYFGKAGAR